MRLYTIVLYVCLGKSFQTTSTPISTLVIFMLLIAITFPVPSDIDPVTTISSRQHKLLQTSQVVF